MQVFLQSNKAFDHLSFVDAEMVSGEIYYQKRNKRDKYARDQFNKMLEEDVTDGIYARDILKGGLKGDELCI